MRVLLALVGVLSVGAGVVGIFLPLLPTTPFLLLAAFCFGRSSSRFHSWLLHHPLVGRYISDYTIRGGMALRAKIATLGLLWLTMGLTIAIAVTSLPIRMVLLVIAVAVTVHILMIKTVRTGRAGVRGPAAKEEK